MARSNFIFRHSAFALCGSAVALGLAGWIFPTPRAAEAATQRDPAPLETAVHPDADVLRVERLASFSASAVPPPEALRDPFSPARRAHGQTELDGGHMSLPPQPSAIPMPINPPANLAPALPALVGIAMQETSGGQARTAVFITRGGDVQFAITGQRIGEQLLVSGISAGGAILVHDATGVATRLTLNDVK